MNATTKTFPVAAGAYLSLKSALTHACEVDSDGFPVRVLCRGVKLESILADTCVATDDAPTCKTCARRVAKRG